MVKIATAKTAKYGLTEKQLGLLMTQKELKLFQIWMNGQTMCEMDNIPVYYYCDISRFLHGNCKPTTPIID